MDVRPVVASDEALIQSFFSRIPEGDRTFIKEDLHDERVIAGLASSGVARRFVAEDEGLVRGWLSVIPGHGWSSHVGELRLVVDPEARGRGLGRTLARKGLTEALDMGCTKVVVEVVASQEAAIAMFTQIGFEGEALLRDHVRDREGDLADLILLAHHVGDRMAEMEASGIDASTFA